MSHIRVWGMRGGSWQGSRAGCRHGLIEGSVAAGRRAPQLQHRPGVMFTPPIGFVGSRFNFAARGALDKIISDCGHSFGRKFGVCDSTCFVGPLGVFDRCGDDQAGRSLSYTAIAGSPLESAFAAVCTGQTYVGKGQTFSHVRPRHQGWALAGQQDWLPTSPLGGDVAASQRARQ